jgi:hypothetical protein
MRVTIASTRANHHLYPEALRTSSIRVAGDRLQQPTSFAGGAQGASVNIYGMTVVARQPFAIPENRIAASFIANFLGRR